MRSRMSLSARRVWIEIWFKKYLYFANMSLSARRVWIEIINKFLDNSKRAGHSPRGGCGLKFPHMDDEDKEILVTLREEGVD